MVQIQAPTLLLAVVLILVHGIETQLATLATQPPRRLCLEGGWFTRHRTAAHCTCPGVKVSAADTETVRRVDDALVRASAAAACLCDQTSLEQNPYRCCVVVLLCTVCSAFGLCVLVRCSTALLAIYVMGAMTLVLVFALPLVMMIDRPTSFYEDAE